MKKYLISIFCACLPFSLFGGTPFCCKGRADVGPVYLHINAIENGKTADSFDMIGVRSDSTLLFFEGSGLCFKPTITYADKDAKFFGYGLGIGYYIPIGDSWYVIPVIGGSYTNFSPTITANIQGVPFPNTQEWIHSKSGYFGGEIGYKLFCDFWVSFIYQYAFARSHTNLHNPQFAFLGVPNNTITLNGSSSGSNYGLSFDYYWKCWSFGAAFGYNNSLDKERFGLEGYGIKLSIGYCL